MSKILLVTTGRFRGNDKKHPHTHSVIRTWVLKSLLFQMITVSGDTHLYKEAGND